MGKVSYLTTVDNPYDPRDEFEAWYAWDLRSGYDTAGFLARVIMTSNALSPADQDEARETAIDEIIKYNVNGMYRRVLKDS